MAEHYHPSPWAPKEKKPGAGFYASALFELLLEVGGAGVDFVKRSIRHARRK